MKLIIAGSRELNPSISFIEELIEHFNLDYQINELISGGARGVDRAGEKWAEFNNSNVPTIMISSGKYRQKIKITIVDPQWEEYGKVAGPMRNEEMAKMADVLLLIWNGNSKGSASMKKEMEKLNKTIYEVIIK